MKLTSEGRMGNMSDEGGVWQKCHFSTFHNLLFSGDEVSAKVTASASKPMTSRVRFFTRKLGRFTFILYNRTRQLLSATKVYVQ